jgi:2,3-bisphosphoglycerate-dependent phosphoglycerate mutase
VRAPILLARHGETDANAARVVQLPDARLSALGRQQAERLAVRVAECGVAHILCSDMTRALETAAPIAARTGLPVTADPLLRERDFGDLRGTPYSELRVDPFAIDYAPPNGETVAEFHARVERAWDVVVQLAARVPGSLLVVTHGLVCRALIERHLHLDAGTVVPDRWHNTALTWIDSAPPWKVQRLHCIQHLQDDAVDPRAVA